MIKKIINWNKFNDHSNKIAYKILQNKGKFNTVEKRPYNHIRDMIGITIYLFQFFKKKKIKFLDYGGNALSIANLFKKKNLVDYNNSKNSKLLTNFFSYDIYNPHINSLRKTILKRYPVNHLDKVLPKKKYDLIIFGSVLQYIKKLEDIKFKNLTNASLIMITQTPISISKKKYEQKQENYINLDSNIHSINHILSKFLDDKYKIIFKSQLDFKFSALKDVNNKNKDIFFSNYLLAKKTT